MDMSPSGAPQPERSSPRRGISAIPATRFADNQAYEMSTAKPLEWNDEMLLPATEQSIVKTAERLMRAVARAAGIPYWDPEPAT
jgi:hypothetical protein